MEQIEVIFLLCLVVGIFIGRTGVLDYIIDDILLWYSNKYGKYTPGDGRNYIQVFKTPVEVIL